MIGPLRITARGGWLPVLSLTLALACTRPIDRPIEGARPLRPGEAPVARADEVPPTVSAPTASATVPRPVVIAAPSPSASPTMIGRNPILSVLLPAPNALVPPGAVNIGARISATSDLTTIAMTVDGAPVEPSVTEQDARTWLVAHSQQLALGRHEVRLTARDRDGRAGGYTWQFEVQPTPRASPSPRPTAERRR